VSIYHGKSRKIGKIVPLAFLKVYHPSWPFEPVAGTVNARYAGDSIASRVLGVRIIDGVKI
jgi:hypothetical protein